MKIELSKKELMSLLEVVYLGEWVINSNDEEDKTPQDIKDVIQKIYSLPNKFGINDVVEFYSESNEYFPNKAFEDRARIATFIEEYSEVVFWDKLIYSLSLRDQEVDGQVFTNGADKHVDVLERESKWAEEFTNNGLDNLVLKK